MIEEFAGWVNLDTPPVTVAYVQRPCGWVEPGQTPEFEDCMIVLRGTLTAEKRDDG